MEVVYTPEHRPNQCPICKEGSLVSTKGLVIKDIHIGNIEQAKYYCNNCETYFSWYWYIVAKKHPNFVCQCGNKEWLLEHTYYNNLLYCDRVCSKCSKPLPKDLELNKNESSGVVVLPDRCVQCNGQVIELLYSQFGCSMICKACHCIFDMSRYVRDTKQKQERIEPVIIDAWAGVCKCGARTWELYDRLSLLNKPFMTCKCRVCGIILDDEYIRQCKSRNACNRCGTGLEDGVDNWKQCNKCEIEFKNDKIVAWNHIQCQGSMCLKTPGIKTEWILCVSFQTRMIGNDSMVYLRTMLSSNTPYLVYRCCSRCRYVPSVDLDFILNRGYPLSHCTCVRCESREASIGILNETMCVQCFDCKYMKSVNNNGAIMSIARLDKCEACQSMKWKYSKVDSITFRWCGDCKLVYGADIQLLRKNGINSELYSSITCQHCGDRCDPGQTMKCRSVLCYVCKNCEDRRCPKVETTTMFRYKNQKDTVTARLNPNLGYNELKRDEVSNFVALQLTLDREDRDREAKIRVEAEAKMRREMDNIRAQYELMLKRNMDIEREAREHEKRALEAQTLASTIRKTEEAKYQALKQTIEIQKTTIPDDDCVICMSNKRNTSLIECGHVVVCHSCADSCVGKPCPICRSVVVRYIKIYVA